MSNHFYFTCTIWIPLLKILTNEESSIWTVNPTRSPHFEWQSKHRLISSSWGWLMEILYYKTQKACITTWFLLLLITHSNDSLMCITTCIIEAIFSILNTFVFMTDLHITEYSSLTPISVIGFNICRFAQSQKWK